MLSDSVRLSGLYIDYYELTMAQGYFLKNRHEQQATFDYFFRRIPFGGGYVVFSGTASLQDLLRQFKFGDKQADWLKQQGFEPSFIHWLQSTPLNVHFEAPPEGSLTFPGEPVMQVSGPIAQCLMVETIILNILNFESLIATKAARMKSVMKPNQKLIDFGLRRAHGLSGLHASRAAYIGGCDSSSNVLSSAMHGHPSGGTHAHAWVQSFESEAEAFNAYAELYPDACTLLVDTYDTLRSGVPKAIKTAQALEQRGHKLHGIRLDSGDFSKMVPEARRMLNEAGFDYVKIVISDNIDEYKIQDLNDKNIPVDIFGVGTRLITANDDPALNGVFKISSLNGRPLIKLSEDEAKTSLPGQKQLYRVMRDGHYLRDVITMKDEGRPTVSGGHVWNLRTHTFSTTKISDVEPLHVIRNRVLSERSKLAPCFMRLDSKGDAFEVHISDKLQAEKELLIRSYKASDSD